MDNMIPSHEKITCYLRTCYGYKAFHRKKTRYVKWFGISVVFIHKKYNITRYKIFSLVSKYIYYITVQYSSRPIARLCASSVWWLKWTFAPKWLEILRLPSYKSYALHRDPGFHRFRGLRGLCSLQFFWKHSLESVRKKSSVIVNHSWVQTIHCILGFHNDATKIQTKKLLILLSFYVYGVLHHLNIFVYTNCQESSYVG